MLNGKTTVSESLDNDQKTECCPKPLFSVISKHSLMMGTPQAIKEWLMSSQPDSPANHSQSQGNKKGLTECEDIQGNSTAQTKEICGRQQQTLFGLSSHDIVCSKMCLEYANTCPWSYETCGDLATPFQDLSSLGLTIAAGRTEGNVSGLWLAPTASENLQDIDKFKKRMEKYPNGTTMPNLATQVKSKAQWRTPDANMERDPRSDKNLIDRYFVRKMPLCLNDQLAMAEKGMISWPTPRAGNPGSRPNGKGGKILAEEVKKAMFPTPTQADATMGNILSDKTDIYFLESGMPRKRSNQGIDGSVGLARYVKIQFPTPTTQDAENNGSPSQMKRNTPPLNAVVKFMTPQSRDWKGASGRAYKGISPDLPSQVQGQLSAAWVEALMAWPVNWSSLEPLSREAFEHWLNNPQWEDWEPDIPRIATGEKNRVNRLKAIGNGQVSIVAATAWRILYGQTKTFRSRKT